MEEKRKDAQIFVLCYKDVDYDIPNNSLYTPLHCGAAVSEMTQCDLKDNVGDNISDMNRFYAETTGTYWIWKNRPENYKYIGQCQYRRQLNFPEDIEFDKIFRIYDSIIAYPNKYFRTIREHYDDCHNIEDLNLIGNIIGECFPDYVPAWDKVVNGTILFYSSGFVFKAEDYNKYCEFLFGVLSEYRNRLGLNNIDDVRSYVSNNIFEGKYFKSENADVDYQMLIGGYLAERLFTCFFINNFRHPLIMRYLKYDNA